jgi:hypothetical protein
LDVLLWTAVAERSASFYPSRFLPEIRANWRLFAVKMSTQKPTINSTEANEGNEENTDRRHEDLTFVPFVPFC